MSERPLSRFTFWKFIGTFVTVLCIVLGAGFGILKENDNKLEIKQSSLEGELTAYKDKTFEEISEIKVENATQGEKLDSVDKNVIWIKELFEQKVLNF